MPCFCFDIVSKMKVLQKMNFSSLLCFICNCCLRFRVLYSRSLHGIIAHFGTDLRGALDNASELCGLAPRIPPTAADRSQQQQAAVGTTAQQTRAEGESGGTAVLTGGGTSGSTALMDQAELDSSPMLTDPSAVARREQLVSRLASSTPQLPTQSSPNEARELADADARATASPPRSESAAGSEHFLPSPTPDEQMLMLQQADGPAAAGRAR